MMATLAQATHSYSPSAAWRLGISEKTGSAPAPEGWPFALAERAFCCNEARDIFGGLFGTCRCLLRVSTDDQSCEPQERDLRAFAKRAGHRIIGVFKETVSRAKNDGVERKKVMALAQAREIDAILVTELSRWGRSTEDLVQTLDDLHGWKGSVLA